MTEKPPAATGSWWATLPGIVTGLAALVTAIAGLIGALHQTGLIGGRFATEARQGEGAATRAPQSPSWPAAGSSASSRTGQAPSAAEGPPRPQAPRQADLAAPTLVELTLLEAWRRPAGEAQRVTVRLRVTNAASSTALLFDPERQLRLLADAHPLTPVRTQPRFETLPARSAEEFTAEFLAPPGLAGLVLVVSAPDGTWRQEHRLPAMP